MSNDIRGFEYELQELLNRHSKENDSNTPDFILANYIHRCLETWAITTRERERWYGVKLAPGQSGEPLKAPVNPAPDLVKDRDAARFSSVGCPGCNWTGMIEESPSFNPAGPGMVYSSRPCPTCVPKKECMKCGLSWGVVKACCSETMINDKLHVKGYCTACCDGRGHPKQPVERDTFDDRIADHRYVAPSSGYADGIPDVCQFEYERPNHQGGFRMCQAKKASHVRG